MHRFLAVPILFCLPAVAAFAAADNGLLALIPAEARVVSSINVQQARTSPLGQFLLSKMNSDPNNGFDKMAQETGFDPRRDLQTFVFASPGPAANKTQSSFVILARGNFDSQWIRKQILSENGTIQNIDGVDVYVGNGGHHQQQQAFALPDVGIAVFGDLASVQEVIANRANPTQFDPALQTLISSVSATSDAWFASVLSGSYLTQHLNDATDQQAKSQAQALQSVRQADGGVAFGDPVQLTFDAVTRSPQDAVSLQDVVRFMASMLQMQRQQNPQVQMLAGSLDNMTSTVSGDHFHLSLAIPESSLEQLADSGMTEQQHHHGFKSATPSQR